MVGISMGGCPGRCMIMRLTPGCGPVETVNIFMTISPLPFGTGHPRFHPEAGGAINIFFAQGNGGDIHFLALRCNQVFGAGAHGGIRRARAGTACHPSCPPPPRCAHNPPVTASPNTNIVAVLFDKLIDVYLQILIGREARLLPTLARGSPKSSLQLQCLHCPSMFVKKEAW